MNKIKKTDSWTVGGGGGPMSNKQMVTVVTSLLMTPTFILRNLSTCLPRNVVVAQITFAKVFFSTSPKVGTNIQSCQIASDRPTYLLI